LYGWKSGSNQHLLFADFDELPSVPLLPKPDASKRENWDRLAQRLEQQVQGRGIVFRSISGKCKVAFVVEAPDGVKMTKEIAASTLQKLLPDDLFETIDKSTSALSITFLNSDLVSLLSSKIHTLSPILINLDGIDLDSSYTSSFNDPAYDYLDSESLSIRGREDLYNHIPNERGLSGYRYWIYQGEIPEELKASIKRGAETKIMKALLALPILLKSFNISQTVMGQSVGVSQKTVSVKLARFISLGLLEVLNRATVPGKKAITYRASGVLREVLTAIVAARRQQQRLPEKIEEGHWNESLLSVGLRHFRGNGQSFLAWAKTVPGIERKDRLRQAERFAQWLDRRFRKRVEVMPMRSSTAQELELRMAA